MNQQETIWIVHRRLLSRIQCTLVVPLLVAMVLGHAQSQSTSQSTPTRARPVTQERDNSIVTNTDLVPVIVTVTDREGRRISSLGKSDFTIYDDNFPQRISHFSDLDEPLSLAIIFDTSKSMSGEKIDSAREALKKFIQTTHRQDEFFLISFSDRAQLLIDRTIDVEAVVDKVTYMEPRGETALFDATYLGIEKLSRASRARRVILLITDGNDTSSRYSFDDLRRSLKESDVILYAIGILPYSRVGSRIGRLTLEGLTSATGGRTYFPTNSTQMIEAFERIALELRSQYSMGFRPVDLTGNRKWHRLKVEVTSRDGSRFKVRSRPGFYAQR